MKSYHMYHDQSRQTQSKLERVQSQKPRMEQEAKKNVQSKRVLRYEKQTEKVRGGFFLFVYFSPAISGMRL